jgi:hypothetical protein
VRVLPQTKDLDSLVHVGIVGGAATLDVSLAALLFVAPLSAQPLIEAFLDASIQLIDIHRVYALLEPIQSACSREIASLRLRFSSEQLSRSGHLESQDQRDTNGHLISVSRSSCRNRRLLMTI